MGSLIQKLLKISLRWMAREDLPQIFELERRASDFPWSPEDFQAVMLLKTSLGMTVEYGGEVIGFLFYEMLPDGLCVHRLAVAPEYQRRGVASQMIARVCCQLSNHQQRIIRADVRESNVAAQMFFQSLGFRANAIFKSHFEDTGEDAYRMHYRHKRYRVPLTAGKTLISR